MTIEERINLLAEARDFYANLSDVGGLNEQLGARKAAALGTVEECLELYQKKMLEGKEWTEKTLEEGLDTVIDEDYVNGMIKIHNMSSEEADFYEGGFGLAIGILRGDEETINGLRNLQKEYEHLEEMRASNKTIADLLK